MRWAFISDIHGNRRALDRVEAVGGQHGVQAFVCLGDVIGRGDPAGCVDWVAEHTVLAIMGNRDVDHLALVSAERQQVVSDWPRLATASDFLVTHGDPGGHRVLRAAVEKRAFRGVADVLAECGARLWLFGHTHHARLWRLAGAAERLSSPLVQLEPESTYIVNVGTAGRPFPGKGGPSIAIYDDRERWIELVPLDSTRL